VPDWLTHRCHYDVPIIYIVIETLYDIIMCLAKNRNLLLMCLIIMICIRMRARSYRLYYYCCYMEYIREICRCTGRRHIWKRRLNVGMPQVVICIYTLASAFFLFRSIFIYLLCLWFPSGSLNFSLGQYYLTTTARKTVFTVRPYSNILW